MEASSQADIDALPTGASLITFTVYTFTRGTARAILAPRIWSRTKISSSVMTPPGNMIRPVLLGHGDVLRVLQRLVVVVS